MWDARFAGSDYLFGTEPADFLKREAGVLPPASRILCLADGEGRNSVYLAGLGHQVTAMEQSAWSACQRSALHKITALQQRARQALRVAISKLSRAKSRPGPFSLREAVARTMRLRIARVSRPQSQG